MACCNATDYISPAAAAAAELLWRSKKWEECYFPETKKSCTAINSGIKFSTCFYNVVGVYLFCQYLCRPNVTGDVE